MMTEREVDMIRGKLSVGAATLNETYDFLVYVEALEQLVEEASVEDFYGSEGWKHRIGWDD